VSLCSVQQETFLKERVKVNGKTGNLANVIEIARLKNKINVTSQKQFSKRWAVGVRSLLLSMPC
jgi:large subunit ribosomal protein L22e